jgi:hypothetical protein
MKKPVATSQSITVSERGSEAVAVWGIGYGGEVELDGLGAYQLVVGYSRSQSLSESFVDKVLIDIDQIRQNAKHLIIQHDPDPGTADHPGEPALQGVPAICFAESHEGTPHASPYSECRRDLELHSEIALHELSVKGVANPQESVRSSRNSFLAHRFYVSPKTDTLLLRCGLPRFERAALPDMCVPQATPR